MKKILVLLLVVVTNLSTYAQEPGLSKSDYSNKAKKQNTAGWFILGTGFTLTTIGLVIETKDAATNFAYAITFQSREKNSAGGALLIGGTAIMATSIPFFIASSKNRKRAATVFIKKESQLELKKNSFVKSSFPALGLCFSL